MKSTILNIKKRVLVVEIPSEIIYSTPKEQLTEIVKEKLNLKDIALLGLGSELSEEIAKGLVEYDELFKSYIFYKDTVPTQNKTALDSFISAIEALGFHWKDNPEGEKPNKEDYIFEDHPELAGNPKEYNEMAYLVDIGEWQESESKTFHPEQVILFEIL